MNVSKSTVAASGVAVLALLLAACGGSSGDTAGSTTESTDTATATTEESSGSNCVLGEPDESITTTARIAYQKIPNGDLIVKDLGILEACMPNATITWNVFSSGGDVIQAYGAGSVDLGLTGSNPAVRALSAPLNQTLPLIENVWIHDVIGAGESLVVKEEISSPADLKGKQIATPFGSTAHYSLQNWLTQNGLEPNDVKLINLEPEAMAAAWPEIAGAWVWDPSLSQLIGAGGKLFATAAETADAGFPTYDLGNVVADFASANTPFMDMWARAQNYAVTMILDSPSEAAQSIAAELGISPDEAQKFFDGYIYLPAADQASAKWLGGQLSKDFQNTAQFLLEQGGIDAVGTPADYEKGVNANFAKAAAE
jgi:taurine transport system substrate-binding protein